MILLYITLALLLGTTIGFGLWTLKLRKKNKTSGVKEGELKTTLEEVLQDLKSTKKAITRWTKDHKSDRVKWNEKERELQKDNETLKGKVEALNGFCRADLIDLDD